MPMAMILVSCFSADLDQSISMVDSSTESVSSERSKRSVLFIKDFDFLQTISINSTTASSWKNLNPSFIVGKYTEKNFFTDENFQSWSIDGYAFVSDSYPDADNSKYASLKTLKVSSGPGNAYSIGSASQYFHLPSTYQNKPIIANIRCQFQVLTEEMMEFLIFNDKIKMVLFTESGDEAVIYETTVQKLSQTQFPKHKPLIKFDIGDVYATTENKFHYRIPDRFLGKNVCLRLQVEDAIDSFGDTVLEVYMLNIFYTYK